MRFEALDLLAFGAFDGSRLEFTSAEEGDLHLIYGSNEAGKSTCLRAVLGFLFGIPRNTSDAHRHLPKDLRIGARLAFQDGSVGAWVRRKGNKNTLLDAAGGAAVAEAELVDRLAGMDPRRFEQVFGLDHETLRLGAAALLEGEGDVAEGLFDAGFGSRVAVHRVLRSLDEEAEAIYKRKGKNAHLNRAIAAYKAASKRVMDNVLTHAVWQEQVEGIDRDRAQLEQLRAERARCVERREHLAAEVRLAPKLARLQELDASLGKVAMVPELPEDAVERRVRALGQRDAAERARARVEVEFHALAERIAALDLPDHLEPGPRNHPHRELRAGREGRPGQGLADSPNPLRDATADRRVQADTGNGKHLSVALLGEFESGIGNEVLLLRERTAAHREQRQRAPLDRLERLAAASQDAVRSGVRKLRSALEVDGLQLDPVLEIEGRGDSIDEVLEARPSNASMQRLRDATTALQKEAALTEVEEGRLRRLEVRRGAVSDAVAEQADALDGEELAVHCAQLEDAILSGAEILPVAESLASGEIGLRDLAAATAVALVAVPGDFETLDAMAGTRAPSAAELAELRERAEQIATEGRALELRRQDLARLERGLCREERALAAGDSVPSEGRLHAQRAERDQLWRQIRSQLGGPVDEQEILAFERELVRADATADHLRTAAEQVARARQQAVERSRLETDLAALADDAREWGTRELRIHGQARTLWRTCTRKEAIDAGVEAVDRVPDRALALVARIEEWRELRAAAQAAASVEAEARQVLVRDRQQVAAAVGRMDAAMRQVAGIDRTEPGHAEARFEGRGYADQLDAARRRLAATRERIDRFRQQEQAARALEQDWREQCELVTQTKLRKQRAEKHWQKACAMFDGVVRGLDRVDHHTVLGLLDDLQTLWALAEQARSDRRALADAIAADRAYQEFAEEVLERAGAFGVEEKSVPSDFADRVDRLLVAVDKLREQVAIAAELRAQEEQLVQQRALAEAEIAQANLQLQGLCEAAGVSDVAGLPEIERTVAERRSLRAEQSRLASEVSAVLGDRSAADWREWLQGGGSLRESEEPAAPFDIARAEAVRHDLIQRIEELDAEIRAAQRELWNGETGLEALGHNNIEEHVLEREEQRTIAEEQIERYVQLTAASDLLRAEMARYREAHQDPLLGRASEVFAHLTGGRYRGLDVGIGSNDQPVLQCVRADGKAVGVEALSDGTADPLYLALRVSTIEHRQAVAEPMPLVLDDVLVHFDDHRAQAAMEILGELSTHCQVLLFSHHQRDVELARRLSKVARIHDLDVLGGRPERDRVVPAHGEDPPAESGVDA